MAFEIDQRFFDGCHALGVLPLAHVLLMDNAEIPWLLLVPETDEVELHALSRPRYAQIFDQVRVLAEFLSVSFPTDKINVACNGNVVRQMHLHVIGRRFDDYCWPDVTIGKPVRERYSTDARKEFASVLAADGSLAAAGYQALP